MTHNTKIPHCGRRATSPSVTWTFSSASGSAPRAERRKKQNTECKNRLVALLLTILPIRQIITHWSMFSENPKSNSNCMSIYFCNSSSHVMCIFHGNLIQTCVSIEDSWVCSTCSVNRLFFRFPWLYYVFMICTFTIYYTSQNISDQTEPV